MRLYTHPNVDLDAVASVWAAREFMGAQDAELVFKPAQWDGAGMDDGDLALDIKAGGRGIKGEERADGTVGSCFAWIVTSYAPFDAQEALRSLSVFVDFQDAKGRAVEWLADGADQFGQDVLDGVSIAEMGEAMRRQWERMWDGVTTGKLLPDRTPEWFLVRRSSTAARPGRVGHAPRHRRAGL